MVEMVSQDGRRIVEKPRNFFLARAIFYDF